MSLRKGIRELIQGVTGNPDRTVFIGQPEIRDIARKCSATPRAVERVIERVVNKRLGKIKAIDNEVGYQIPRDWF